MKIELKNLIAKLEEISEGSLTDEDIDEIYNLLVTEDAIEKLLDLIPEDILADYVAENYADIFAGMFIDTYGERAYLELGMRNSQGSEFIGAMEDLLKGYMREVLER